MRPLEDSGLPPERILTDDSLTGLSNAADIAVPIGVRVTVSACSSSQPGGLPINGWP
jgi:hypothetical protein